MAADGGRGIVLLVPAKPFALFFLHALACSALLSGCRSEVSGWVLSERASTPAPQPEAAPPDAGCPNCAVSVVWTGLSATPQFGMRDTVHFDDACPDDEAIIGFRGSVQDVGVFLVSSIETHCGKLVVSSTTAAEATVVADATLPERGTASGASWSQMCPRDQMVVGFWGRSGASLDQIGFDCAGVRVSRGAANDWLLSVDSTISELSPPNGGDGGEPFRAACPPGQIALTANIVAGDWIDAFGLTCATPTPVANGPDP